MIYVCPMHSHIRQEHPGTCSVCGMALVPETGLPQKKEEDHSRASFWRTYRPLIVIVGLIVITSIVAAWDRAEESVVWLEAMQHWMAGFFLVFSGFKLLDIPGFAKGYATYDLLAMRWKGYGYVYPFIELLLGLLYLQIPQNTTLNICTLILMLFSGLGVTVKLARRERFRCACLGTFIDVPLTTITLVEDFGMAAMAGLMLAIGG